MTSSRILILVAFSISPTRSLYISTDLFGVYSECLKSPHIHMTVSSSFRKTRETFSI